MATGANYPTSFDSYANKVTGDFLTIADVNSRSDAIEALESGPLRPSDGSISAPAYSFQNDSDTGIWRSNANTLDIGGGGARIAQFVNSGTAVNFFSFVATPTTVSPEFNVEGADTNIGMTFDSKGTGAFIFRDASGTIERMRISEGRILHGTTVTTNVSSGEMLMANAKSLRGLNAAATNTRRLISFNASNHVTLAEDGDDIKWGNPIVGLGGGAAPTLGTIGGSGPTVATQNSWLRFVDHTGAPAWVPVWK